MLSMNIRQWSVWIHPLCLCWHSCVDIPVWWLSPKPTFNNITNKPALISSGIKLLMNQLSHRMPLFSPMILMVSLSLASFSYTTPLMMMATEYIHARVMKRGIDRLITLRKLWKTGKRIQSHTASSTSIGKGFIFSPHTVHLHVINITGVGHLLNVDACPLTGASDGSDDSLVDDILQVGKSAPDVPKVLEGVCSGTRVPIPTMQDGNYKSLNNANLWKSASGHRLNGNSPLPIFNLVRPLHIINVHADLIVDVGGQVSAVAAGDVRKYDSCPEFLVVQETHGLVDQSLLISHWLQFVQVHTLWERKWIYVMFWCVWLEKRVLLH